MPASLHALAVLVTLCLLNAACTGYGSCQAAPASPAAHALGGEIDVEAERGSDAKAAATPALAPCMKDATTGCDSEAEAGGPRVVTGKHYEVKVLDTDPRRGPAEAPVILVVFSDFECPFCSRLESTLDELRERYPTGLRIVWKDMPLSFHESALPAARLARQAYRHGGNELFWRVHRELFLRQRQLNDDTLQAMAKEFSVPWPAGNESALAIDTSLKQARELGVRSTPTSFINGHAIVGNQPLSDYTEIIDRELGASR